MKENSRKINQLTDKPGKRATYFTTLYIVLSCDRLCTSYEDQFQKELPGLSTRTQANRGATPRHRGSSSPESLLYGEAVPSISHVYSGRRKSCADSRCSGRGRLKFLTTQICESIFVPFYLSERVGRFRPWIFDSRKRDAGTEYESSCVHYA